MSPPLLLSSCFYSTKLPYLFIWESANSVLLYYLMYFNITFPPTSPVNLYRIIFFIVVFGLFFLLQSLSHFLFCCMYSMLFLFVFYRFLIKALANSMPRNAACSQLQIFKCLTVVLTFFIIKTKHMCRGGWHLMWTKGYRFKTSTVKRSLVSIVHINI
jgi:hypothetical protein